MALLNAVLCADSMYHRAAVLYYANVCSVQRLMLAAVSLLLLLCVSLLITAYMIRNPATGKVEENPAAPRIRGERKDLSEHHISVTAITSAGSSAGRVVKA